MLGGYVFISEPKKSVEQSKETKLDTAMLTKAKIACGKDKNFPMK